jgi:hypothetical protein
MLKVQGAGGNAATTANANVLLPSDLGPCGDATLKIRRFSAPRHHALRWDRFFW